MNRILHNLKWMVLAALVTVFAGCSKENNDDPVTTDPEMPNPVVLSNASAVYYGYDDTQSCDHYTLKLFPEEGGVRSSPVVPAESGMGIYLDLYAPVSDEMGSLNGTYSIHKPLMMSKLFKFIPGSNRGGSYLYSIHDRNADPIYISDGELVVTGGVDSYTIQGRVLGEDGTDFVFKYVGALDDIENRGPMALDKNFTTYLGKKTNGAQDNFTLCCMTEDVVQDRRSLYGLGMGVYLDVYAPLEATGRLPMGTYTVSETIGDFTLHPGQDADGGSGSFVYIKKEGSSGQTNFPIIDGTLSVSRTLFSYKIKCTVMCSNFELYTFTYEGKIYPEDVNDQLKYVVQPKTGGIYFGTMMDDNFDNYSFMLLSKDLTDEFGVFDGVGIGISFDMYAPLGSGVVPPVGSYTLFGENQDESKAFKFMLGMDWSGMLSGSYIYIKNEGDSEKTYVYVIEGVMTIAKHDAVYKIKVCVLGEDGKYYNFSYTGDEITIMNPFE